MKPIIILKTGDTLASLLPQYGDFEHWISAGLGDTTQLIRVIDPREGDALPAAAEVAGAIVTGSHAMVSERLDWSETSAAWLRQLVEHEVPVLGICYGHQLLAHALGGEVGYHPRGMEIGTAMIEKLAVVDPLFDGLPAAFAAQTVHQQTALRLPEGAVLLAHNAFEPHHAFRIGSCAWGVQFHPEFSATAMRAYVRHLAPEARRQGIDPEAREHAVGETPEAGSLLHRFGDIVRQASADLAELADSHVRQIATFPLPA